MKFRDISWALKDFLTARGPAPEVNRRDLFKKGRYSNWSDFYKEINWAEREGYLRTKIRGGEVFYIRTYRGFL